MSNPESGRMYYWRMRSNGEIRNNNWRFGYCTWLSDPELVRMGRWNGDTMGGPIVSKSEIEIREYRS